MADIFDQSTRSYVMSRVKSKDTSLEIKLRHALWKKGHRYRNHYNIKGNPDIAFPKNKIAIFVDGDFWHGYRWDSLKPKLKNDFWVNKIENNMKRDARVNEILRKEGWKVIRFWGHEIEKDLDKCVSIIESELSN